MATFYHEVSIIAKCHHSRIQRLVACRRDSPLVASNAELDAFAKVLDCTPEELATEAAERVVAG